MTTGRSERGKSIAAQKTQTGLLFGLIMGLAFALAAWGYDAWMLAQANAVLPWTKFALGLAGSLAIGAAAGRLTARLDHALASALIWLLAGAGWAVLAGILPFDVNEAIIGWLRPDLAGQVSYPYNDSAQTRTLFTGAALAAAAVIVGLLEMPRVDTAVLSTRPAERLLALLLPAPILLLAGFAAADGLINKPLRSPVVVVDRLIGFARESRGQAIDGRAAREMHVGALGALSEAEVYESDYELLLIGYDEQIWLNEVLVDFGGSQASCVVMGNQPSFCKYVNGVRTSAPAASPQAGAGETAPAPTAATGAAQEESTPAAPEAIGSLPIEEALLAPGLEALPALQDAPRYTITATIDFRGPSYTGQQVLDYTNTEDVPQDRLYLRLLPNGNASYGSGSLQVSDVRVDGQPVETSLSGDETILEVPLAAELPVDAGARISLDFRGEVPVDFGGEASPSGYGIFNFTEDVLTLSGWYPMLAVYNQEGWNLDLPSEIGDSVFADASLYTITLQTPPEPVLVATGTDVDGAQADSVTFVSGPVREFFVILSTDFQVVSQDVGGTRVNSYYLPGHEAGGRRALEVAVDSLAIFNERFGPYPYTELDVVDAPMQYAAGVEFPGVILIATYLYDDPESPTFEITVSHEVAHQWWYNVVGNDVFDEPWLDEALTTYASSLYYEEIFGESMQTSLQIHWQNRVQRLDEAARQAPITAPLSYFESRAESSAYGGIVYSKGGLFFAALREEIGDRAFFEALQNYYAAFQFDIADGESLLEAFETAAGRELDAFYDRWLYGEPD